jgi:hypothetical protein
MRAIKLGKLAIFLFLTISAGVGNVWADRGHGHSRFDVFISPAWGPWYYPAPQYYYPPVVIERAAPPVYIERSMPPPAPEPRYWYYCNASGAYYPYVKECPSGWQRVLPQPESR